MPHDPKRIDETRAWLGKALHDLQAAEAVLMREPQLPDVAVFHCQQAAEKAFKAFLLWHDVPFRRTHELEELGRECVTLDPGLATVADRAVDLTPFAWRFRYPGDLDAPAREDTDQALALAREVYSAILARLPEEVRPPT